MGDLAGNSGARGWLVSGRSVVIGVFFFYLSASPFFFRSWGVWGGERESVGGF